MRAPGWLRALRHIDFARFWRDGRERVLPRWRTAILDADMLPADLPKRRLLVARDGEEWWSAGMRCPCGCGEPIELPLIPEADQHWTLELDRAGRPTLSPSVWRKTGCRSHFWLREGRVRWC